MILRESIAANSLGGKFLFRLVQNTLTVKFKIGATAVCATAAVTPTVSYANNAWTATCDVTVLTLGSSGTVEAQGMFIASGLSSAPTTPNIAGMGNTAAVTLDTTVVKRVNVDATWSSAAAGDSIQARQLLVEVLH
jgi:hypothetical protein